MSEKTSTDLRLDLLLVEDNRRDARLIQEQLEEGPLRVRLRRARTLEAIRKGAADAPVVVLTGTDDRDLAVRSLRRGAQDYLTKGGATPEVLARSIRYARERKAVMADLQRAVEERGTVVRLMELGLSLSVDDFGTGHSTLAQLRFLPLDEIKIDRSFIRGLPSEERDLAIVRSVLTLSESLGLTVVAEGIEEDGQLSALRELGCAYGQGYLLGRPEPAAAVEEMLRDGDRPSAAG